MHLIKAPKMQKLASLCSPSVLQIVHSCALLVIHKVLFPKGIFLSRQRCRQWCRVSPDQHVLTNTSITCDILPSNCFFLVSAQNHLFLGSLHGVALSSYCIRW